MLLDKIIWALGKLWGTSRSLRLLLLAHAYSANPFRKGVKRPFVLFALDGEYYGCGFADKLRGIISAYAMSKVIGYDFKIKHTVPFVMENYLTANTGNLYVRKNDISYSLRDSKLFVSLNLDEAFPDLKEDSRKQLHVYTNRDMLQEINERFSTDFKFDILFNELFIPSPAVLEAMNVYSKELGGNYVSVSFRFMNLLGDFHENGHYPLESKEQEKLINVCIGVIEEVKAQNEKEDKVLVTSDSMRFMQEALKLPFVYVVPGNVSHSGYATNNNDESTMKTFLDFLLISKAKKVYLGMSGSMYKSNFARTAALSQGKEFKIIKRLND